jgi:hypothetical protein
MAGTPKPGPEPESKAKTVDILTLQGFVLALQFAKLALKRIAAARQPQPANVTAAITARAHKPFYFHHISPLTIKSKEAVPKPGWFRNSLIYMGIKITPTGCLVRNPHPNEEPGDREDRAYPGGTGIDRG